MLQPVYEQVHSSRSDLYLNFNVSERDTNGDLRAYVAITRASHASMDGPLKLKARGMGVQAFSPRLPHSVTEKWYAASHVEYPVAMSKSSHDHIRLLLLVYTCMHSGYYLFFSVLAVCLNVPASLQVRVPHQSTT